MKKFFRFLIALAGLGIGVGIVSAIMYNLCFPGFNVVMRYSTTTGGLIFVYVAVGFLGGIIAYSTAPQLMDCCQGFARRVDGYFRAMPAIDIVFGIAGVLVGMLCALLVSRLFSGISSKPVYVTVLVLLYAVLAFMGWNFGTKRRSEIIAGTHSGHQGGVPKVLDTSAVIDGRILDICKTGIVEGEIYIPEFVLKELRHIADHSDASKRGRGRRGLDVIRSLQQELGKRVIVDNSDFPNVDEVDLKLLELTQKLGGMLITDDYNLNKVAGVRKIPVLNVNDLANAVKPVLLPGEELELAILREGKEAGQGVGFLEDGTMVIVEGGRRHIGETVTLQVTSSLQTSAGRMIFARVQDA